MRTLPSNGPYLNPRLEIRSVSIQPASQDLHNCMRLRRVSGLTSVAVCSQLLRQRGDNARSLLVWRGDVGQPGCDVADPFCLLLQRVEAGRPLCVLR
jgi:hypothetical protein